jgi:hypothetical protein
MHCSGIYQPRALHQFMVGQWERDVPRVLKSLLCLRNVCISSAVARVVRSITNPNPETPKQYQDRVRRSHVSEYLNCFDKAPSVIQISTFHDESNENRPDPMNR